MTLSGWTRLWIVASVIWWIGAGTWGLLNVQTGWRYAEPNNNLVVDYSPAFLPVGIIVLAPFAVALVFVVGRALTQWVRRGFPPN